VARVIGEARFDVTVGKWFYVIFMEGGEELSRSDSEFASQEKAEAELIYVLRRLSDFAQEEEASNRGPRP